MSAEVNTLQRRDMLRLGAGAMLATIGGIRVARAQAADASHPRLVVILLRGAMDGLSLVVPYADNAYYQARPNIAIARPGEADGCIRLDANFGLHPAAAAVMPYWERHELAFVHASGSPDATRSHFDAQDYMESGTPGRKATPDGWMNRLASALAGDKATPASQRLEAVNLGPTMPRIFTGDAPVASLASGNGATRRVLADKPEYAAAFAKLYAGDDRMSTTVREAGETRREIMDRLASDDPKADQGALSLNGLQRDTARLGQLMQRDARVRLAFVPVGGWDTHANQGAGKGQLANRFLLLAQSIDALAQSLGPRLGETTILVMSEFGRTVRQNGSNGTDHGHGDVMWALGGGVRGGKVYGDWTGLDNSALYEGRDLAVTTDFRDVIGDVLEQRFALRDTQLDAVLPGMQRRKRVGLFG